MSHFYLHLQVTCENIRQTIEYFVRSPVNIASHYYHFILQVYMLFNINNVRYSILKFKTSSRITKSLSCCVSFWKIFCKNSYKFRVDVIWRWLYSSFLSLSITFNLNYLKLNYITFKDTFLSFKKGFDFWERGFILTFSFFL